MNSSRKVRQLCHKVVITIISPYKSDIDDAIAAVRRIRDAHLIGEVHSVVPSEEFTAITGVKPISPEDVGLGD